MQHHHRTHRNRIARGAAAVAIAASAALGGAALSSVDAGAWTPAPDGPLGGGWRPSAPVTVPPTVPRITLPESAFRPTLPDLTPLPPVSDLPVVPPVEDDSEPSGPVYDGPVRSIPEVDITPIDPDSLYPDDPLCEFVDCSADPGTPEPGDVPEDGIPPSVESDECLPPAPPSGGSDAGDGVGPGPCGELTPDGTPEDLGYPDSEGQLGDPGGSTTTTEPTAVPVRVESATGSLAFTGSDIALPLAGAGLLGAGGVLAGISVLARRVRSGRS